MSKAEERALEAYPVKEGWEGNQYGEWGDLNLESRKGFREGYEQAEKDIYKSMIERMEKIRELKPPLFDYDIMINDVPGPDFDGGKIIIRSWEPTAEQMQSLLHAAIYYGDCYDSKTERNLMEIYEHFKNK